MIKEQLDQLIRESILTKNSIRTNVLRAIKTKFMECETAKNAKPLDEQAVIRKMISDRMNSREIYLEASREDLANAESDEIMILLEFKEADISEEDVRNAIKTIIDSGVSNMGEIMKGIKSAFPNVDMKLASSIVKESLT